MNNRFASLSFFTKGLIAALFLTCMLAPELKAQPPTASLMAWYRGDAGTTGTPTVSAWADQSSSGNNATQTTAADRPTLTSGSLNGLPALTFDGTNDYMVLPAGFSNFTSGMSLFMVTETASTANQYLFSLSGSGATAVEVVAKNDTVEFVSGTSSVIASSVATNQYHVLEFICNGSNSVSIYDRGTLLTTGTVSAISNHTRTTNNIGANAGAGTYHGAIAEVLLYNTALSATARASVETYLNERYFTAPLAPTISPNNQVFSSGPQTVSMSANFWQQIFFTVDGSQPSTASNSYTAPFKVSASTVVKAIAVQGTASSATTTSYIQIDPATASVPRTGMDLWLKGDFGPVLSSGTNISTWTDMSGSGNNASQATAGKEPNLLTSAGSGIACCAVQRLHRFPCLSDKF